MAVELIDLTTGFKAGINSDKEIKTALTPTYNKSGFAALVVESDPGERTGYRHMYQLDGDDDFRLRTAIDSYTFNETFAGAALNSAQWSSNITTMATAVSGGYLKLNSAASIAASAVARVTSYRTIALDNSVSTYIEFPFQYQGTTIGTPNTVVEAGLFIAATTASPTDGVFMRWNLAGELRLVLNYNGTESQSDAIDTSWMSVNTDYRALIVTSSSELELWIDNVLLAKIDNPTGTPTSSLSNSLPINFRVYNGVTPPTTAVALWVGTVIVTRGGVCTYASAEDASALSGWGGYQGQSGGTMGQTANYVNSTIPASATLSNIAAGYATLGGQYQFAAVAGAETDYALFAYLIPAALAGGFNRNFLVRGVTIDTFNMGAAVATTTTTLQWAIGVGSTGVSLATAEAAAAKAPRRIALGVQSLPIGAAIGANAIQVNIMFYQPILAEPGTYIHVILKMPVGTATASQIIRGTVAINGGFAL